LQLRGGRHGDTRFLRGHAENDLAPAAHHAARGVARAEVTVAHALTDAHRAQLEAVLKEISGGKSVDVDVTVDPSIIGGLVVKLGSRMVDGSLRTKLNSIRSRMKEVG